MFDVRELMLREHKYDHEHKYEHVSGNEAQHSCGKALYLCGNGVHPGCEYEYR